MFVLAVCVSIQSACLQGIGHFMDVKATVKQMLFMWRAAAAAAV